MIEQGNLNAAMDTLKKGRDFLKLTPEGRLVSAVVEGMVHTQSGEEKAAKLSLDEASKLRQAGARGDSRMMLDLAGTYMAHGRHEEGDAIVAEVAKNAHDSETLLNKAKAIYSRSGRETAGEEVLKQATLGVRQLNNEGVSLAQKGDFDAAVQRLLVAASEAPYNPRVLMNAVWVILRAVDKNGLKEDLLQEASRLLNDIEQLAPTHSRLPGLRTHLREIEARFGIKRRTTA
jgi:Tfp pilus assembly protein PilF